MALKNAGRVSPVTRGLYSSSSTYERLDIVTDSNGSSFMAKQSVTGITPAEGDYWQKLGEGVKVDGVTITKAADGTLSGSTQIDIDSAISSSSNNPVKNSVISAALDGKVSSVKVNGTALVMDGNKAVNITDIPASILSGTIDLARIPAAALERITVVSSLAEMYELTTATVQLGDVVKVTGTSQMFMVKDTDHLDSASGYEEFSVGSAASVPWTGVTGKPSSYTPASHTHTISDVTDYSAPTLVTGTANGTVKYNGTDVVVAGLAAGAYKAVDSAPTANSTNLVTSGGVAAAIPTTLPNANALTISGGGTQVISYTGSASGALNLVAGTGVTLSVNASTGTITINNANPVSFTDTDIEAGSALTTGNILMVYAAE